MQLTERLPILVIGKHGKTGSRVNKRLQTLGYPTRAVSTARTPSFDCELPETWHPAMEGTLSAYVTYQPNLAVPAAEPPINKLVCHTREAGLQHLALLSSRDKEISGALRRPVKYTPVLVCAYIEA
jgi:hypothetical protein